MPRSALLGAMVVNQSDKQREAKSDFVAVKHNPYQGIWHDQSEEGARRQPVGAGERPDQYARVSCMLEEPCWYFVVGAWWG